MGKYVVLSAVMHLMVFLLLWIPAFIWVKQEPARIINIQMLMPNFPVERPTPEPTKEKKPTEKPTPEPTEAVRSMAGKDFPSPTPTLSPTNTKKPTATPTFTQTQAEPTATMTVTPTSVEPTATPSLEPSNTPEATKTPKPSNTPKPSATQTAVPTKKPTSTPKPTEPPKATPTPTINAKATALAKAAQELEKAISEPTVVPEEPKPVLPAGVEQPKPVDVSNLGTGSFYSQGTGIATSIPFGDAAYISRLVSQLQQNFHPPRSVREQGKRTAVVYFKITKVGDIQDIRVVQTSGHKKIDEAATMAVEAIRPFDPLPRGTADLGVTMNFVVE